MRLGEPHLAIDGQHLHLGEPGLFAEASGVRGGEGGRMPLRAWPELDAPGVETPLADDVPLPLEVVDALPEVTLSTPTLAPPPPFPFPQHLPPDVAAPPPPLFSEPAPPAPWYRRAWTWVRTTTHRLWTRFLRG